MSALLVVDYDDDDDGGGDDDDGDDDDDDDVMWVILVNVTCAYRLTQRRHESATRTLDSRH